MVSLGVICGTILDYLLLDGGAMLAVFLANQAHHLLPSHTVYLSHAAS